MIVRSTEKRIIKLRHWLMINEEARNLGRNDDFSILDIDCELFAVLDDAATVFEVTLLCRCVTLECWVSFTPRLFHCFIFLSIFFQKFGWELLSLFRDDLLVCLQEVKS